MYFDILVRQACSDNAGYRIFYRTKSGYEGSGWLDGYGEDYMRLQTRGLSGVMSHKFVRFCSLEEILFDEGSDASCPEEYEKFVEQTG